MNNKHSVLFSLSCSFPWKTSPLCSPCLCFSKDFAFNWTEYSAGFKPKFLCKKATHSNQLILESIKNNKRDWNEIISRALLHSQENRFIALAERLSQAREMQVITLSPPGFSSCPQSKTMRISELISSLKTSLPCPESLLSALPVPAASLLQPSLGMHCEIPPGTEWNQWGILHKTKINQVLQSGTWNKTTCKSQESRLKSWLAPSEQGNAAASALCCNRGWAHPDHPALAQPPSHRAPVKFGLTNKLGLTACCPKSRAQCQIAACHLSCHPSGRMQAVFSFQGRVFFISLT